MQKWSHFLSDIKDAYQTRIIRVIIDPTLLPPLRGQDEPLSHAERIRRDVLAYMAVHRTNPVRESSVLALLRAKDDASWWEDTYFSCRSASGVFRALLRESSSFAQNQPVSPPSTVFFVDSENVTYRHAFITELCLTRGIKVVFCYTEHSHGLHDHIKDVQKASRADVSFVDCGCGTKNALDFQLIGLVGEHLSKNADDSIRIITNDTGYDPAVSMYCKQGYDVRRIAPSRFTAADSAPAKPKETPEEMFRREVSRKATSALKWTGYKGAEKERLVTIIVSFACGDYDGESFAQSISGAIGHLMQCGNRYIEIYRAEKQNIHSILSYAEELRATGAA